jgi:acetyltransferase
MENLSRMFDPATVAVIGASEKEGSAARMIIDNLLTCQDRKVFAVNPRQQNVCQLDCYESIQAVPAHVNLAIVTAPAATVPAIVDACGKAGVDGVIIASDGFRETGEEGRKLEEEIARIKKNYPMRIVGPNSLGIIRPNANLCAARVKLSPEPGSIALLTQSTAVGKVLFDWGLSAQVRLSMLASLGSSIDVDFGDLIDYLGNDPYTRNIIIYLEDRIGDLKKFASAARGFSRNKPIVLLKPSGIIPGAEGTFSHTDMLTNSEDVFDALLTRVGVVRVKEAQDLYNMANVLNSKNLPKGPRLAIVTNAAGAGWMAANRLVRSRGQLARFSAETRAEIDRFLPSQCPRNNPIDLLWTATIEQYEKTVRACLSDPGVDGVLVVFGQMDDVSYEELAQAMVTFLADASKPVLATLLGPQSADRGRSILMKSGFPTYHTPESAVRTYLYMCSYERNLRILNETPSELLVDEAPPKNHLKSLIRRVLRDKGTALTDEDSRKFLVNYGIPLVNTHTARNVEEALSYADAIGYPIVLKISSPDIIFRQDVGGVITGVTTPDGLRRKYARLIERVQERLPDAVIHGVTVQKMIDVIDYEVILGAKKDPEFGAAILFGMGGIGVEVYRDYAVALPPLNQTLARRLMEDTKVYEMLKGYRGKPPADLRQLEQIIVSFSNLIVDFPEILAMDMNPIAISDGKATALDARIILDPSVERDDNPYRHLVITPYPVRYISRWHLPNGTEVLLRPIKPEDEPLEHEMFTTLSEETLRERFYQRIKTITHAMHARFCNIDYDREMAIVAEIRERDKRRIIGIGSFVIDPNHNTCEYSVVVHDDYQRQGLASKLLDILIGIADEKGIEEFYGFVEPTNRRMVKLTEKLDMVAENAAYDLLKMTLRLR